MQEFPDLRAWRVRNFENCGGENPSSVLGEVGRCGLGGSGGPQ